MYVLSRVPFIRATCSIISSYSLPPTMFVLLPNSFSLTLLNALSMFLPNSFFLSHRFFFHCYSNCFLKSPVFIFFFFSGIICHFLTCFFFLLYLLLCPTLPPKRIYVSFPVHRISTYFFASLNHTFFTKSSCRCC